MIGLGQLVEQGVGEAVGAAHGRDAVAGAGVAFEDLLHEPQGLAVKGDEEVFAQDEVEVGGGELVGLGVVHRVHDDVEVVVERVDFREGRVGGAVLDDDGMEAEEVVEDDGGFLGGGFAQVDPQQHARLGAEGGERIDRRVLLEEPVVAINERRNHGDVGDVEGGENPQSLAAAPKIPNPKRPNPKRRTGRIAWEWLARSGFILGFGPLRFGILAREAR